MASTRYASMSKMRGTWSDSPETTDASAYDDPDEPATIAALIMGSRPRTRAHGGAHDASDEKYGASTLEPEVRELFASVRTGGADTNTDDHLLSMLDALDDVITGGLSDKRDDVDDYDRDEDDTAREDDADTDAQGMSYSSIIGEPVIDESDDEIADDINDAVAAIDGIIGAAYASASAHRWRDDYANALAISQM